MSPCSVFAAYLDKVPLSILSMLQSSNLNFTIFIPTNEAFANLPASFQEKIMTDDQLLSEVSSDSDFLLDIGLVLQLCSWMDSYGTNF